MNSVFDASALLALANRERGHEMVTKHLPGAVISAVNLSEVYAKAIEKGSSLEDIQRYVAALPISTVPFDDEQAAVAATFRGKARQLNISFADTACLALGLVSGRVVISGEQKWQELGLAVQLKVFR